MCASIKGGKNPQCVVKANVGGINNEKKKKKFFFFFPSCAPSTDLDYLYDRFEYEHTCWDPKDGELCLNRVRSEETLMEARSDTDVQIVRQIWV